MFSKVGDLVIVFMGAGKAAKGLGLYFEKTGIKVTGYYDKDFEKALKAAELTNTLAFRSIDDLIKNAEIIIVSTGDDFIEEASYELQGKAIKEKVIIGHLSGLHNSYLLSKVLPDFSCFSLHPLHSFSGSKEDVAALKKTSFTIEGDIKSVEIMTKLFGMTENKILRINPEDKINYHAACVFASNYVTTIISKSMSIFENIGISKHESKKMLEPLIKGTVENLLQTGPEKSLTGPIARGDVQTIEKHIEELKKNEDSSDILYKALGNEALNLASKELLKDKQKIEEIKSLLKD